MKVLWFTWKDQTHPFAGGAEVVTGQICKRLAADGHEVILLAGGYGECQKEAVIDGYRGVRVGGQFSAYWCAYRYYKKNLVGWADIVIEEANIVPFFTQFYVTEKRLLFYHQLGRKVWLYQIFFPLNVIGYLIEPFYTFLLRKNTVITISESTKKDLQRFGFDGMRIHIISEGIDITCAKYIEKKNRIVEPILLSFGNVRAMKRTGHIIRAFEIAKKKMPQLKMVIVGSTNNSYGMRMLRKIEKSPYAGDITMYGRISPEQKKEIMRRGDVIAVTSIKEGWGLIVTEANSQGTPAVVYNVDGLCDSVRHDETGIICQKNTPQNLAENVLMLLQHRKKYDRLRRNAWMWSKNITFDKCYRDFMRIIRSEIVKGKE